jgi:hypothetical protein
MWEGQATSRNSQVLVGALLGLISLPFLYMGIKQLYLFLFEGNINAEFTGFGIVCAIIGFLGSTLSYRLIFARGVKQGGGILTPLAFKAGRNLFIAMSVYFVYFAFSESMYKILPGAIASMYVAYLFHVAERHRGAMRNIEK